MDHSATQRPSRRPYPLEQGFTQKAWGLSSTVPRPPPPHTHTWSVAGDGRICTIARTSISVPPCGVWTVAGGWIPVPLEKAAMGEGNESPLPASLTLFAGSLACAHVRLTPPTLPTPTPCRLQGDREKPHS